VTRWAWVIDHTRCIGCHACTTACKSENDVALGVFRTWVKQVDVGVFPAVRRHFAVLRCNHCEEPPCVYICPVTAMYQRPDGLVDFDEDRCIGCKACMQACPYDAIYMDPDTDTAAKCNFCSHRVDQQLLPACVVVCPVEALLFGDLDDPTSKVSRALGAQPVSVRRPEQGTRPKAFYVGAHQAALDPLGASHETMYMWSDRPRGNGRHSKRSLPLAARVSYDIPKPKPWGWKVSLYIWTKSVAAGSGLLAAAAHLSGATGGPLLRWYTPLLALIFLGLTGALLVADLKRPERFWTVLTRPQWRSWLARGAFIITGYGLALALWVAAAWLGAEPALDLLAWPLALLAVATAIYTASLLGQCEARDLWQSPLTLPQLALHALVAGLAALFLAAPFYGLRPQAWLAQSFAVLMTLTAALAAADAWAPHSTTNAAAAARSLTRGRHARPFWVAVLGCLLLPAALVLSGGGSAVFPAAALALAGLLLHSHALVLAGQEPPIS
jgi:Fe-S-cluster-containing dehydrogenase component/formate-dependent nitrite reductase membrane component NrfD